MRLSKTLLVSVAVASIMAMGIPSDAKSAPKKVINAKVSINYSQIVDKVDNGYYDEADKILLNYLKANPNDITANSLYAGSLARQGRAGEAQAIVDKFLPKYPNSADLHYVQGVIYVKRQASSDMSYRKHSDELISKAVQEFITVLKINPKYYQAYNALGITALNMGNLDKATEFFSKAIELYPNFATGIDNWAGVDFVNGDYDAAQKKVERALALGSNSPNTHFHLAKIYDKKALYSKALDELEISLRGRPDYSVAYNLKGEILVKQGNYNAAIEAFKKAISVGPENIQAYINLTKIYEKRFDNELAAATLKSVLEINPNLDEAKLHLAELLLLNGNNNDAINYYSALVGDEEYNADALRGLANAYFAEANRTANHSLIGRERDLEHAYKNIELAIKANPNDMELYLAKLKLAKIMNKEKESKETLNKIIETPTKGLTDLLTKGDAYFAMNRYQEAKESFENAESFAQTPDDSLFIAEILIYDRFYPSAKRILRQVLKNDPSNIEAIHNLQYIMEMEKQSDLLLKDAKFFTKQNKNKVFARDYALKSLEFNPINYNAAKLSAKLCEKQKHYEDAVDAYKVVRGLETKPRKINKLTKKIAKLEKKVKKYKNNYMKSEDKNFKNVKTN